MPHRHKSNTCAKRQRRQRKKKRLTDKKSGHINDEMQNVHANRDPVTGSVFCEAQLFKQDALVIVETLIRNETEKLTHFEYIRDYHSYK